MKKNILKTLLLAVLLPTASVAQSDDASSISKTIDFATKQVGLETAAIQKAKKPLNPVTLNKKGEVSYCSPYDWRSGFFPGTLWYLYELTGDEQWAKQADT